MNQSWHENLTSRTRSAARPTPDPARTHEVVVELEDVSVDYGSVRVLEDFSLEVRRGELVALLGPSGSGKTTVLRTIAGFLHPSHGSIRVSGRDVTHVRPHKRAIGVVFQSYALFPHMTVAENIAYPLKVRKQPRAATRQRVEELVDLVRLGGHADKKPARLSGGQAQRVAIARALAMEPDLLLLDEPLSNLDANLRRDVGEEIRRLQQRTGSTAIMVTHDRQEAFGMADRIAVLRQGKIEQVGRPEELYRRPATPFMATFVGEANLIQGVVSDGSSVDRRVTVRTAMGDLRANGDSAPGTAVEVLVRPEDVRLADGATDQVVSGRVSETFYYGDSIVTTLEIEGVRLSMVSSGSTQPILAAGETVRLRLEPDACLAIPTGGGTHVG